jgi:hypothetical protein
MKIPRSLLILVLLLGTLASTHAQIGVDINIKRRLFIRYEPVLATVTLTNNTGRDITLTDSPRSQWFSFQIVGENNTFIPPRNLNYRLDPMSMKAGETLKRTVNLTDLYALDDLGLYSVRANIHFSGLDRDFASRPTHVEVTEGRRLWQKAVGVPEGMKGSGQTHTFTMLSHLAGENNVLYVRVQDQDEGTIFATYGLGRMVDGVPPQMQFDSANNLYVLQLVGQRTYSLSVIGVNGEFMGQSNYTAPKVRPYMRKAADGRLELVNAQKVERVEPDASAPEPAKLSDRPVALPFKR